MLDFGELVFYLVEHVIANDASSLSGFVSIFFENVPSAEADVVQRSQRDIVPNGWNIVLGSFAKANSAHLAD
jgi:hypothetical protein